MTEAVDVFSWVDFPTLTPFEDVPPATEVEDFVFFVGEEAVAALVDAPDVPEDEDFGREDPLEDDELDFEEPELPLFDERLDFEEPKLPLLDELLEEEGLEVEPDLVFWAARTGAPIATREKAVRKTVVNFMENSFYPNAERGLCPTMKIYHPFLARTK